jgi:UDP-N-acetylmuramate--alanine ligase
MHHNIFSVGLIHFVGIGGIGMSGIAEVLHHMGHRVQGSDQRATPVTDRLVSLGITVHQGHKAQWCKNVHAMVISTAIPADNPEVLAAKKACIPILTRAEMLAELMRFKTSIAIAGAHGKTTTTSLVATLLNGTVYDPTVINGGIVNTYQSNAHMGDGGWMVVEADESDGSFTHLPATIGVVTNIDHEHLDFYKTPACVEDAYRHFLKNIPFYGLAVMCLEETAHLMPQDRRVLTYGFDQNAQVRAYDVRQQNDGLLFNVHFHETDETWSDLFLPMVGDHNVLNSLAAISIAHYLNISADHVRYQLSQFGGVKRRFTYVQKNPFTVVDDYAHHPVEITKTIQAAQSLKPAGKLHVIMQPHRYSRLQGLFDDFAQAFDGADTVWLMPVYAAGEISDGCDQHTLGAALKAKHTTKPIHSFDHKKTLSTALYKAIQPGDFVLCLGAGDSSAWIYEFTEATQQKKDIAV